MKMVLGNEASAILCCCPFSRQVNDKIDKEGRERSVGRGVWWKGEKSSALGQCRHSHSCMSDLEIDLSFSSPYVTYENKRNMACPVLHQQNFLSLSPDTSSGGIPRAA